MSEQWVAKHMELATLGDLAYGFDVRPLEERVEGGFAGEVAEIRGIASKAVALLAQLTELAEGESGPAQQLGDIAFMARLDIRQRMGPLDQFEDSTDHWQAIAMCSSLRRHLIRSLSQVERSLCDVHHREAKLSPLWRGDLARARASRHAYLGLIREVRAVGFKLGRGALSLHQGLRFAAASIAKLIGRDIYQDLRIEDRQQLRALHRRIFTWARSHTSDDLHARRLWQDLSACVELLLGIHQRSELIEHDFRFVSALIDGATSVTPEQRELLAELEGREPELDRALADSNPSPAALHSALVLVYDRLATTLGRPPLSAANS